MTKTKLHMHIFMVDHHIYFILIYLVIKKILQLMDYLIKKISFIKLSTLHLQDSSYNYKLCYECETCLPNIIKMNHEKMAKNIA